MMAKTWRRTTRRLWRCPRGVASVELALVLVWLWLLGMAFFALLNYLYQYTVTRHASHVAAATLATMPHYQLYNYTEVLAARRSARFIVENALAGAGIPPPELLDVVFTCNEVGNACREFDPVAGGPLFIDAVYTYYDPFWVNGSYSGSNQTGDWHWIVRTRSAAVFLK